MLKNLPEPLVNMKLNGEEPDFHWPDHKSWWKSTAQATTARARNARTRGRKPRGATAGYEVLRVHGAAAGPQASPRSTRATSAGGVPLTT